MTTYRIPLLVGACASFFLSASARAQTVNQAVPTEYVDPQRGLSLDDLVALALEHSPRIAAARERVDAARGDRRQAGLRPNPTVGFEQMNQTNGADAQFSANVTWPLDVFRRGARETVADRSLVAAELREREARWQLAGDVRRAAIGLLGAVQRFELAQQVAAAARQFRNVIATRVEAGSTPPLERDLAEVDARRLEADAVRHRGEAAAAFAELRALTGLLSESALALRDSLEAQAMATLKIALARNTPETTSSRPDLARLQGVVGVALAEERRLHSERLPTLDLFGGYQRTSMSFPQLGIGTSGRAEPIQGVFHQLAFGAMVSLPVLDRNQGAVAAAAAVARTARREEAAGRLEAEGELAAARARLAAAGEALGMYRSGLLDLARSNLAVLQQTYELGRATLAEVIAERRRVLEIELDYSSVLLAVLDAGVAVQIASGVTR